MPSIVRFDDYKLEFPRETYHLLSKYYDNADTLLQSLVYPPKVTTIRILPVGHTHVLRKQELIQELSQKFGCPVQQHNDFPEVLVIGPCASENFERRVRACEKYVVVDRFCGEAVLRGSNVYAPGIKGCTPNINIGDDIQILVDVSGKMQRGCTPEDFDGVLLQVAHGRLVISRKEACSAGIKGIAVEVFNTAVDYKLPCFAAISEVCVQYGYQATSQGLPSIVTSKVLLSSEIDRLATSKKKRPIVLDMCAAPGGKTTHLASLLQGKCVIVACDRSKSKVKELIAHCRKYELTAGISNSIFCFHADSSKLHLPSKENTARAPTSMERRNEYKALKSAQHSSSLQAKQLRRKEKIKIAEQLNKNEISQQQYDQQVGALHVTGSKAHSLHESHLLDSLKAYEADISKLRSLDILLEREIVDNGIFELAYMQNEKQCIGSSKFDQGSYLLRTPRFRIGSFEFILLDAPCSALGLTPRLGISKGQFTLNHLQEASRYQKKLIDSAISLLKPGGTLVYSTCTLNPLENEGVVAYVLKKYNRTMQVVPQVPRLGKPGLPGFEISETERHMLQRFEPSKKIDNMSGFFIAKFVKLLDAY